MSRKEEQSEAYIKPIILDRNKKYLKENNWKLGLEYTDFTGYEVQCAFEAGAEWQKEQMMKDAVVATVTSLPNDWGEYMPIIEISVDRDYQEGSKVKVLIIKEE